MEIVSENEEEIGVVFTLREFRILMALLGYCDVNKTAKAGMMPVWEKYSKWSTGHNYEYDSPIKTIPEVIKFSVEEEKLFEMQSM